MSSKDQNLSSADLSEVASIDGLKIHIVVSDWNAEITQALLEGAQSTLVKLGMAKEDILTLHVPGTFELPVTAKTLLKSKSSEAIICLGCVIKGDTEHDIYINQSVANALNQLAIVSGIPIIFGVLTVNTKEQAMERAGGKHGNKGVEAAVTAAKMVHLQKDLNNSSKSIGF